MQTSSCRQTVLYIICHFRVAMKDSLCELKRSPVLDCLPHWAWSESDAWYLNNFVDFWTFNTPTFFKTSWGMNYGQHLQGSDTSLVLHFKKKAKHLSFELLMYSSVFFLKSFILLENSPSFSLKITTFSVWLFCIFSFYVSFLLLYRLKHTCPSYLNAFLCDVIVL